MATFGLVREVSESDARERLVDRVFTIAAMVGGIGGAIAGAVVNSALGIGYPTTAGWIGTMLGSFLATVVGHTVILPKLLARSGK